MEEKNKKNIPKSKKRLQTKLEVWEELSGDKRYANY